jgi:hypothetical protein
MVFGERPRWREGKAEAILEPERGHRMTATERLVLETCRTCTASNSLLRPTDVAQVADALASSRLWRARSKARAITAAACLAIVAPLLVWGGQLAGKYSRKEKFEPPMGPIVVGEPSDWTETSTILAEIDDGVTCLRVLPDGDTIRYVWGTPAQAEDVNIRTRRRTPSPLVPEAYREGCPDLSPDGKQLVFPGHTLDGRAFAFVSDNPDGTHAVPTATTAEPSFLSEPTWVENKAFSYDIDAKNMAVYFLTTKRSAILAPPTSAPYSSANRHVGAGRLFVTAAVSAGTAELTEYEWPTLSILGRTKIGGYVTDLRISSDGRIFYTVDGDILKSGVGVVPSGQADTKRLGVVKGQYLNRLALVRDGLIFTGVTVKVTVEVESPGQGLTSIPLGTYVSSAAPCGADIALSEVLPDGRAVISRLNLTTLQKVVVTAGPDDGQPSCTSDGSKLFHTSLSPQGGLSACDEKGCRLIYAGTIWSAAVSPDGGKIGFILIGRRGPGLYWMNLADGSVRTILDTETVCKPVWSSATALWVSRRRGTAFVWTEIELEEGRATGRELPGASDCTSGWPDPKSPGPSEVRLTRARKTQVRLIRNERFPR